MRPSPFILQTVRYATYTLLVLAAIVALSALLKTQNNPTATKGLLIDNKPKEPATIHMDASRALEGFSAPADTHVLLTVPVGPGISRTTFFGGPDLDEKIPYWGYCFAGDELRNRQKGLTGNQVYHPEGFFYSLAEQIAHDGSDPLTARDPVTIAQRQRRGAISEEVSVHETMVGGETCYLMTSSPLPVGVDTDGDGLNNTREKLISTDPTNVDTDRDGATDAQEVLAMHTNPLTRDSDSDNLPDTLEDNNQNGNVDPDETDPASADTDRDGLCDGDGTGSGCPEAKYMNAVKTDNCPANMPVADCRNLPLVRGEDLNQNGKLDTGETDPAKTETYQGITDWQWKFQQMGLVSTSGRFVP